MMRRPLYICIPVVCFLLLSSCLKEGPFKRLYEGFEPPENGDGWIISDPAAENMDPDVLENAYRIIYEENRYKLIRSLLVVRNGRLVAEAYPRDQKDMEQIQNIQSATKAITSVLTGIALEEGLLDSVSQRLSSIYPELFEDHPNKASITIHQALSMTTGIGFENSEHTALMYLSDRSVDFVLSLPRVYVPGTSYNYNDGNHQLISYAIQYRYGNSLAGFAEEYLFGRLGITDWMWESARDGISFGAFSLYLKPRDMAKIGQMLLQGGQWNGRIIVDSSWIALATRPHYQYLPYWVYGYSFWISPFEDIHFYTASGHGGQMIYVVPEKNLVIVTTAWPYCKDEEPYVEGFKDVLDLILESCL
jgi:CubicO group peptidase (beta-lactamase class C family)